jgi:hypothetical protein
MMSVEVSLGRDLTVGIPRQLLKYTALELSFWSFPNCSYAVAPDGRLFYVEKDGSSQAAAPIAQIGLITNWVEELKAKVAAGQSRPR